MVSAEQHLGGGGEVQRAATRLRAAINVPIVKLELYPFLRTRTNSRFVADPAFRDDIWNFVLDNLLDLQSGTLQNQLSKNALCGMGSDTLAENRFSPLCGDFVAIRHGRSAPLHHRRMFR
jgi:hypothetical protein